MKINSQLFIIPHHLVFQMCQQINHLISQELEHPVYIHIQYITSSPYVHVHVQPVIHYIMH